MPECICFLFHQMRLELWAGAAVSAKTNRPPGWFLSKVIAPLYRLMRLEMKKTAESGKPMGHTRGCNYDDFNEFFWTPACLKFGYHENQEGELTQARSSQQLAQQLQGKSTASIVDSISKRPLAKTFGRQSRNRRLGSRACLPLSGTWSAVRGCTPSAHSGGSTRSTCTCCT